jgi:hypothetical protein
MGKREAAILKRRERGGERESRSSKLSGFISCFLVL